MATLDVKRLFKGLMWFSVGAFFICLATAGVLAERFSDNPISPDLEHNETITFPWRGQVHYITPSDDFFLDIVFAGMFGSLMLGIISYAKTTPKSDWIRKRN